MKTTKKQKETLIVARYESSYLPTFAYCMANCLICENKQSECDCQTFESSHEKYPVKDFEYYCTDYNCRCLQAETDAESDWAYFKDSFRSCLDANFNRVKVYGSNLDWRHSSATVEFDNLPFDQVLNKIISHRLSDFTVELIVPKANGDVLFTPQNPFDFGICLYHHDCPQGSFFQFERLPTTRAILDARRKEIADFHAEQKKKMDDLKNYLESIKTEN